MRKKRKIILWILGGLFAFFLGTYIFVAYLLPLPDQFSTPQQIATTKIYDRNGVLLYELLNPKEGRKTYIEIDKLPKQVIDATLAAEDINFYEHSGVDALALVRALYLNLRHGRIVSGGSTITQQLVKNMLGVQQKRSYSNKLREIAYAIRLNKIYDKEKILEMYLNKIYYGNLAYGMESAALEYFNKHVYDLDLAEAALLAGLPQSPSSYNPFTNFDKAKQRQKYVLEQMLKHDLISQNDFDEAIKEKLKFKVNKTKIIAPHFVHLIIQDLEEEYGEELVHFGGLEVYTTLDRNYQAIAEDVATRHLSTLEKNNVTNAALISIDVETGQVLAWLGSQNYFDEEIDGAVDILRSLRQPGSSLKPFNYLLAFEKDYNPATIIYDIESQFETDSGAYTPKNYSLDYNGMVRVREALASSLNIPAVKVLDYNTPIAFMEFLQNLGIESLNNSPEYYGLSLTLGGAEVRLQNLAEAYLVLAHYGEKLETQFVLKVLDSEGQILQQYEKASGKSLLGPNGKEHAYQIIDILKDPDARLIGFGENSILELSRPAAVKTGTTRNFKDNITAGFTPELLTVTWVGNADASAMFNVSGIDGAAPIWHEFMERALEGVPINNFPIPSNLKQVEICEISGKLPTELCKERIFEWFVAGTEPTEYDDVYQKLIFDKRSGLDVSNCEEIIENPNLQQFLEEQIFTVLPAELQEWGLERGINPPPTSACQKISSENFVETESPLYITSPSDKDSFQISNEVPLENQKIFFKVAADNSISKIEWILNEESIGTSDTKPFKFPWKLKKGKYELRAKAYLLDSEQELVSKEVSFEVK